MRLDGVTQREHCYVSVTSSRAYSFPRSAWLSSETPERTFRRSQSSTVPPGNMCTGLLLTPV